MMLVRLSPRYDCTTHLSLYIKFLVLFSGVFYISLLKLRQYNVTMLLNSAQYIIYLHIIGIPQFLACTKASWVSKLCHDVLKSILKTISETRLSNTARCCDEVSL